MKNTKNIFSAIFLAVLFLGTANAQFIPSAQRVLLTGNDRAIVEQRVGKHTAFTIDNKQYQVNTEYCKCCISKRFWIENCGRLSACL